jgi:hypothetical protein
MQRTIGQELVELWVGMANTPWQGMAWLPPTVFHAERPHVNDGDLKEHANFADRIRVVLGVLGSSAVWVSL